MRQFPNRRFNDQIMKRTVFTLTMMLPLLSGCRGESIDQIPDDPDELTLFSIDGPKKYDPPPGVTLLYDCPVLGHVDIVDPHQRQEVMSSVKEGIRNAPKGTGAACFVPRHLVRVGKGGKTVDVAICFQCHNYVIYQPGVDSRSRYGGTTTSVSQALLNKILTDAGVPISPNLGES